VCEVVRAPLETRSGAIGARQADMPGHRSTDASDPISVNNPLVRNGMGLLAWAARRAKA